MKKKFNYFISKESNAILNNLSFEIIIIDNYGMYHAVVWSNDKMKFAIGYDRGYFDCQITPHNNPQKAIQLFRLLRYLKDDKKFYAKELSKV